MGTKEVSKNTSILDDLRSVRDKISEELNRKFGTESYDIRCQLYDIREAIKNMGHSKTESTKMYIATKTSSSEEYKPLHIQKD